MSAAPYSDHQPIAAIPHEEVQKICAGEVVERPLSVVKELIENALDAGARDVRVELEDGGRRLIRVSDDGWGIPAAELPLAVKPHCTSKLRSVDDLMRLSTLGFRGEALSSIAAVSKLTLSSQHAGEMGARIEVQAGALAASSNCNLRGGTEVEVGELFYNVPARLKFLRSASSEATQVSALLTSYALAYPEVKWTLTSAGRTILASDGDGDQHAVLADLLGSELTADLAPIEFEYPPMAAYGFVSAPHRHWHNRTRQWFLINRRPVGNKLLYKAVDDAMREFVSPGKFPAGVFMLDLPPEEIDVNVHPAKTEVAFAQPEAIYSLLLTAVRRALGNAAADRQRRLTHGMSLAVQPVARENTVASAGIAPLLEFPQDTAFDASPMEPELDVEPAAGRRAVPLYDMGKPFVVDRVVGPAPSPVKELKDEVLSRPDVIDDKYEFISANSRTLTGEAPALPELGEVRQITQVADTYLVLTTASEVYLIDQHSAHERVLFEELWEKVTKGSSVTRQMLLLPIQVQLGPAEAGTAKLLLPEFERLGFAVQVAGNTLEVSEVPALLAARITPELLASCVSEIASTDHLDGEHYKFAEAASASSLQNAVKNLVATMACKAAVKAGQRLPESEREELVRLICSRWSSLSCPHGRPTVVRLGEGELEKMFLRT
jgi:DNA mismatch repair protein MutL